ncbi:HAD family hydrolase [Gaoshiqia sediminis]|uniref:HAD family phosphatase n=1 Tax=Gaoshiqia sediminis TaxID=2986998 RepID=A0AA41Y879_9BACT|nr:HAD family phosphatase [Gaoshiqia sediminis]MCW0483789.1 HAD family phosphatase [Gaoshiqia sediminis]
MNELNATVKNIIFDLGGVLLDIDPDLSIEAFRKLGMPDLIKPGGWGYHHEVFLNMEQGLLSDDEFRNGIRALLPRPVSSELIDEAWCAMIIDFPLQKVQLLQKLQADYRLYLFSNTNSIHITCFHQLFREKFNFSLSDLFVKDYYSSEIGLRKPSLESFGFVLNDAGLLPAETLFIDDSGKNIEGAQQAGMQTVHFTPGMELSAIFGNGFSHQ